MKTIISHGFRFSVETGNTHKEELTFEAAEAVKAALDAMGRERVSALHANLLAEPDFFGDDWEKATRAGELVSAYEDFVVSIMAEVA